VISPLLMNVALHGLETDLVNSMPGPYKPTIVRYADDFVILHKDLAVVQSLRQCTDAWLVQLGLNLKPSKTRISHTLHEHDGNLGFDFLGFTVRQYPVGQYRTGTYRGKAGFKTLIKPSKTGQKRHMAALAQVIHEHRSSSQTTLIAALNRKMKGWAMYYRTCVAKHTFCCLDYQLYRKLYRWAKRRHSHQSTQWRQERYWPRRQGRREFNDGRMTLMRYADIRIKRHVKVRGDKSPFDGDWTYWVPRLGRDPSKSEWVVKLLHRQQGRCKHCGLYFMTSDVMEIHHANGNRNNNLLNNLELVHGHCHDEVHGSQYL
jgi:RNA-directed DNA polymerase